MADGLPWIQVAVSLPFSDEADELEDVTGVERAWTHVVELWCWIMLTRPDGDVTDVSPARMAKRASWPADPAQFVETLRRLGWLKEASGRTKFVGWDKRYAATLAKKEKDRKRLAAKRAAEAASGDDPGESQGRRGDDAGTLPGRKEKRREEKKREEKKDTGASAPTVDEIEAGLLDGRSIAANKADTATNKAILHEWAKSVGKDLSRIKLTKDRRRLLERAYDDGYQPSDVIDAARALPFSPFHMGKNQQRKRYDDFCNAFRDSHGNSKVEANRDLYRENRQGTGPPERVGVQQDLTDDDLPAWVTDPQDDQHDTA